VNRLDILAAIDERQRMHGQSLHVTWRTGAHACPDSRGRLSSTE
jgi:hypothetical protein